VLPARIAEDADVPRPNDRAEVVCILFSERFTASARPSRFALHAIDMVTEFVQENVQELEGLCLMEREPAFCSIWVWLSRDGEQLKNLRVFAKVLWREDLPKVPRPRGNLDGTSHLAMKKFIATLVIFT
jgi:hypothetical protein